mgnify:CR=1 FL=1
MNDEKWDWRERDTPAHCAWCGTETSKLFNTTAMPADEEYRGNAQIISRKPRPYHLAVHDLRLNRGTYRAFRYGAFCKLRCAEAFANAAHDAGHRVDAK